jgi:hypothetical protein
MFEQRIPLAAFEVDDLEAEYARLGVRGVAFTREPTLIGAVKRRSCGGPSGAMPMRRPSLSAIGAQIGLRPDVAAITRCRGVTA